MKPDSLRNIMLEAKWQGWHEAMNAVMAAFADSSKPMPPEFIDAYGQAPSVDRLDALLEDRDV